MIYPWRRAFFKGSIPSWLFRSNGPINIAQPERAGYKYHQETSVQRTDYRPKVRQGRKRNHQPKSIPYIPFIKLNLMFSQEVPILFLKCHFPMMLPLLFDVFGNTFDI